MASPAARRHAILVATGADRPGVLDDVSLFLHEHHASIIESRVCLLRGQFALLLLVSGDDEPLRKIEKALPELGKRIGIDIRLSEASDASSSERTPLRLRASGNNPAVVVHRLSHLMRVLNVNIENIETGTSSDPLAMANGGESAAFELEMELSVPRSTPVMMLRQYVESLARELSITCDVNPL
jgi:glycine cleavage system transcriptional repressor